MKEPEHLADSTQRDEEEILARRPAVEMARHLLTCGDEDHVVTVLFDLMQDRDDAREQLQEWKMIFASEARARAEVAKELQEARDHALSAIAAAARESGGGTGSSPPSWRS
jgi:hypothetical protein